MGPADRHSTMTRAGFRFPNVQTISVGDVVDYTRKGESGQTVIQVRITAIETDDRTGGTIIRFERV